MLNCIQASELASRSMDDKLPIWTKLGLKIHLLICSNCRVFMRQLKFLQEATRRFTISNEFELSLEARQRIANKLDSR